ncbi:uncharacterized protein [Oscarella lobularis]|uniref:uncharacterized protein isoform X2 n=1 Tax=Oscarella lobularis TaxID=121494 RepID=UPI0033144CB6
MIMGTEAHAKITTHKWNLAPGLENESRRGLNSMPRRSSSAAGRRSSQLLLQATSSLIKGPSPSPIPPAATPAAILVRETAATAPSKNQRLLPSPRGVPVSDLAGESAVLGAVGGWFNSRARLKTVPLSYSPSEFLAAKRQKRLPMASRRFLPEPSSHGHQRPLTDVAPKAIRLDPLPFQKSVPSRQTTNRKMKKTAESLPHRVDRLYMLSGKSFKPINRYEIDREEIERLKSMTLSRNARLYYGQGLCEKRSVSSKTSDQYEQRLQDAVFNDDDDGDDVEVKREEAEVNAPAEEPRSQSADDDDNQELEEVFGQDGSASELKQTGPGFVVKNTTTIPVVEREIGGGGGGGEGIENLIDTEQKEAFAAIFSRLTRDGSRINLLDFQKLMFPKATPDETSSFFSVFDLSGSGQITMQEFEAVMALNDRLNGKKTTNPNQTVDLNLSSLVHCIKTYKEMFQTVDDNSDGKISMGELTILLSAALGLDSGSNPKVLKKVMAVIDKDDSGFIEFSEFLLHIPFFVALHQRICSDPFSLEAIDRAKDAIRRHSLAGNTM